MYGPYSPGVAVGGMVWLAGQISPEAGDGVTEQTAACLAKVDALLQSAGCSRDDIVFNSVVLADIDDFSAMNEVYAAYFEGVEIPPARAAFEAGALPRGAKVEIICQAVRPE